MKSKRETHRKNGDTRSCMLIICWDCYFLCSSFPFHLWCVWSKSKFRETGLFWDIHGTCMREISRVHVVAFTALHEAPCFLVKMQYFTLKKSVFVSKQQSLQSLHGILTKNSRKSPKFGQKEGKNSIFLGKFTL